MTTECPSCRKKININLDKRLNKEKICPKCGYVISSPTEVKLNPEWQRQKEKAERDKLISKNMAKHRTGQFF